jgi:tetratricopeptide (TPR) repeat protein
VAFLVCLLVALCTAVAALAQPQSVPRMTERVMDKASYVALAKEWKQYIEKNGETADALVNLGKAYDYSEESEAAVIAGRRAVELEPDNPKALAFLGKMVAVYLDDEEEALPLLERCVEVAPDYEDGLIMLVTVYLRLGDREKTEEVFKTIFDQRVISQPLQDYAYNMLVGLPPGAVLITNGDSDTFPPLALQAGMDFRKDVVVINRSLLNLSAYAKAVFRDHPSIEPDHDIDAHETKMTPEGNASVLSNKLVEKMIDERKVPVFIAASVNTQQFGFDQEFYIEGINFQTSKKGLSAKESARLFLDAYRLDSATDWNFPWALVPKVSQLVGNYVSAMVTLVNEGELKGETKTRILERAAAIADFHKLTRLSIVIESLRKK